jgi:hypothetical protein
VENHQWFPEEVVQDEDEVTEEDAEVVADRRVGESITGTYLVFGHLFSKVIQME